MEQTETIFAPASGQGRAAISVLRLSGPRADACLAALTLPHPLPAPRRLVRRDLRDPTTGEILDQALVVRMPGPESFTGEDQAEFHLHGGLAVRAAVLRALGALPGCRPARAGEFTQRAFLAGRLDLTEVEGLADLIEAETEAQRRQALRQLDGALGQRVAAWRTALLDLGAQLAAILDFADEGDVDADALAVGLQARAAAIRTEIEAVLAGDRRGERLREGFVVVLAGAPNAGKSTLLNALAGRDAAIVSPVPGTTRDAIEVRCDLDGLPVLLVDTAGLRESADVVEAEGVARSHRQIANADLVLWLVEPDGALPDPTLATPCIVVRTKVDVSVDDAPCADLTISAKTGAGLDALLARLTAEATRALGNGSDALVTRERQRIALIRCTAALARLERAPTAAPELAAEDCRTALHALGEVAGRVGVEDILDQLFAGFCIGK